MFLHSNSHVYRCVVCEGKGDVGKEDENSAEDSDLAKDSQTSSNNGEKSASGKELESPDDEESGVAEHIELEAKEPMPPVQKKVGKSRHTGPKFARVQVCF